MAHFYKKDKNKEKNNIEIKLAFGHQARSRMLKVGKDSSQASVTRWLIDCSIFGHLQQ